MNNSKKKTGRLPLPAETAARKKEMSSVALIVEFEDGNRRLFWTNEFASNFPQFKRGKIRILCDEFQTWELFNAPKYNGKIRSAAIFDTRIEKNLKQEYKLMNYDRGLWYYTNYAQLILTT